MRNNCNYSWARADVDFDYGDNSIEICYNSDENNDDSDSDSSNEKQTIPFIANYSVCYTEMRSNLKILSFVSQCFPYLFYKKNTCCFSEKK